jgi:hypothetical protein
MSTRTCLARSLFASAAVAAFAALPPRAAATTFNHDFGAGCATMTMSGRAVVCSDGTNLTLHSSVTPGCAQFALARQGADYTLVCARPNLTGLWWRADENGRGTWISHQADTIFAVDYAYDAANAPRWRTMVAAKRDDGTYSGEVWETRGPAFNAPTFDPQQVATLRIGYGWIAHDDAEHVRVDMAEGSGRELVRQQFGPLPACAFGLAPDLSKLANYTDLWWNPAESGWGINVAHEGDTLFAAWYTYNLDGTPLFLVATMQKSGAATYAGDLYRATGPAGTAMQAAKVGTATLAFASGNAGTLGYSAQLPGMTAPAAGTKAITRQVFAAPGAACQ